MTEVVVRAVRVEDLTELAELCREHAAYDTTPEEQVAPLPADLPTRLHALFFADPPPMWCYVAEVAGEVVGYASYSWQPSTWRGDGYVLLDCLFVRDGHRGLAVGRQLFDAGVAHARSLGTDRLQWQTPVWNEGSRRFYDRTGAEAWRKMRYTLPL